VLPGKTVHWGIINIKTHVNVKVDYSCWVNINGVD